MPAQQLAARLQQAIRQVQASITHEFHSMVAALRHALISLNAALPATSKEVDALKADLAAEKALRRRDRGRITALEAGVAGPGGKTV